jgi:hypothetical protein
MNDADRERAVRELTRHCGDGRLTLDELEDRIAEVYAATTETELALAFRELPPFRLDTARSVRPAAAASVPAIHPARRARPAAAARCGMVGMDRPPIERVLRTVWFIGGIVALCNGLFLLAMFLWFLLPKLVLPHLRRHDVLVAHP